MRGGGRFVLLLSVPVLSLAASDCVAKFATCSTCISSLTHTCKCAENSRNEPRKKNKSNDDDEFHKSHSSVATSCYMDYTSSLSVHFQIKKNLLRLSPILRTKLWTQTLLLDRHDRRRYINML